MNFECAGGGDSSHVQEQNGRTVRRICSDEAMIVIVRTRPAMSANHLRPCVHGSGCLVRSRKMRYSYRLYSPLRVLHYLGVIFSDVTTVTAEQTLHPPLPWSGSTSATLWTLIPLCGETQVKPAAVHISLHLISRAVSVPRLTPALSLLAPPPIINHDHPLQLGS